MFGLSPVVHQTGQLLMSVNAVSAYVKEAGQDNWLIKEKLGSLGDPAEIFNLDPKSSVPRRRAWPICVLTLLTGSSSLLCYISPWNSEPFPGSTYNDVLRCKPELPLTRLQWPRSFLHSLGDGRLSWIEMTTFYTSLIREKQKYIYWYNIDIT